MNMHTLKSSMPLRGYFFCGTKKSTRYWAGFALLTALIFPLACADTDDSATSHKIGVLLPFTGQNSGVSASVERALIMASENINAIGGVADTPIELLARDSHSTIKGGRCAANSLIFFQQIEALMGPNDDDLALKVIPQLRQAQIAGLSGGTSAPALSFADDDGLWFQTSPNTLALASALAEKMIADGVGRASVIYESSEYGSGWANALIAKLTLLGAQSNGIFSVQAQQDSFSDILHQAFSHDVDAVVLIANASQASTIINEWASIGHPGQWYFGPRLNNPVFMENVGSNLLEGTVGVSPGLSENAISFANAYQQRWEGERPLRSAYYYYDALVLWALAAQDLQMNASGYAASKVSSRLLNVSRPEGTVVEWDQMQQAFDLLGLGENINYEGASGPVDLNQRGDTADASVDIWSIVDGQIIDETHMADGQGE